MASDGSPGVTQQAVTARCFFTVTCGFWFLAFVAVTAKVLELGLFLVDCYAPGVVGILFL